jgi:hypothetical protein
MSIASKITTDMQECDVKLMHETFVIFLPIASKIATNLQERDAQLVHQFLCITKKTSTNVLM